MDFGPLVTQTENIHRSDQWLSLFIFTHHFGNRIAIWTDRDVYRFLIMPISNIQDVCCIQSGSHRQEPTYVYNLRFESHWTKNWHGLHSLLKKLFIKLPTNDEANKNGVLEMIFATTQLTVDWQIGLVEDSRENNRKHNFIRVNNNKIVKTCSKLIVRASCITIIWHFWISTIILWKCLQVYFPFRTLSNRGNSFELVSFFL